GFEIAVQLRIDEIVVLHIERLGEVDVSLVQGIPEMVVRRGYDLVECSRPLAVARGIEHRRKVAGIDSVVRRILGDVVRSHSSKFREVGESSAGKLKRKKNDEGVIELVAAE